ncbi:MAG: hypothetical protein LAO31_23105 [Acidobacteriia bacterium]|nr:hypothetical protein [Terriglobia bacterium]
MAVSKRRELVERIEELEAENEALQSQIDEIAEIVGDGEQVGEEEGEGEGEEQGTEDDDQGEE